MSSLHETVHEKSLTIRALVEAAAGAAVFLAVGYTLLLLAFCL